MVIRTGRRSVSFYQCGKYRPRETELDTLRSTQLVHLLIEHEAITSGDVTPKLGIVGTKYYSLAILGVFIV